MRAKIRKILEECIEIGIERGYERAHKHHDEPRPDWLIHQIEHAIWSEIDERFEFERNLCDEVVEGFDRLKEENT